MEWVVDATSPHINCFCFFLNDLQVNLSVSGRYLLSCREDNLGKIWLIVDRVTWVAVVFVAPLTTHIFFVCFFLDNLPETFLYLIHFAFLQRSDIICTKYGKQLVVRVIRAVSPWRAWKHHWTDLAHLTSNGKAFQSLGVAQVKDLSPSVALDIKLG